MAREEQEIERPAKEPSLRPHHEAGKAHAADQPFAYPLRREFVEPDWTRIPGFAGVAKEQWESAQWQRAHSVKNLEEFKRVLGEHLSDELYAGIERDQQERATMSMLIPPQMINTMNWRDLAQRPGPQVHGARPSPIGIPSGPTTRWPRATACTRPTCGPWRASPTATRRRCWPRCSRRARSTAATARAWTWSATTPPRS